MFAWGECRPVFVPPQRAGRPSRIRIVTQSGASCSTVKRFLDHGGFAFAQDSSRHGGFLRLFRVLARCHHEGSNRLTGGRCSTTSLRDCLRLSFTKRRYTIVHVQTHSSEHLKLNYMPPELSLRFTDTTSYFSALTCIHYSY